MDLSCPIESVSSPQTRQLAEMLLDNAAALDLEDAVVFLDFPLYRDDELQLVLAAPLVVVSRAHGVLVFATPMIRPHDPNLDERLRDSEDVLDQVFNHLRARLIKQRGLRRSRSELLFPVEAYTFAAGVEHDSVLGDYSAVSEVFRTQAQEHELSPESHADLISTIEGAKGIIRPKARPTEGLPEGAKGRLAAQAEAEICMLDGKQREGAISTITGPQRIRGLAGSGKTIVLAMKAALIHLREPEARILYTFHTKSLYQHVKRLITRFYRQFDERDPDFERAISVMHSWGGRALPGVYSTTCSAAGVSSLTFSSASNQARGRNPFDVACSDLLTRCPDLPELYDYVFIDEGQDFPISFLRLCASIARENRFVLAYDELQTIFQIEAPSADAILGVEGGVFEKDIVLHKCYRNPRELLLAAHALGFGIYRGIVQMLENAEHWEDLGYRIDSGEFVAGASLKIERPLENGLKTFSLGCAVDDLVAASTFPDLQSEVKGVVDGIISDLQDGLCPDDIMVVCVDDRAAQTYLESLQSALAAVGVSSNNTHGPGFNPEEFTRVGSVTLTTVHKAKGNEAFLVYVVGVDALFPAPTIRGRNILFVAMTRAKGWVRVSGVGRAAAECVDEIQEAKARFPYLEFVYPGQDEIRSIRRDLEASAARRLKRARALESLLDGEIDEDEILRELEDLKARRKSPRRKGDRP